MRKYLSATLVGGLVSGLLYLASFQIPVVRYLSFCLGLWCWVGAVLSSWIATQGDARPSVRKGGVGGLLGGLLGAVIVTGVVAWIVYHDRAKLESTLATAKVELKVRGDYDRLPPSLKEAYDHPEVVQLNAVMLAAAVLTLQFGVIGFVGGLLGVGWLVRPRRPGPPQP